MLQRTGKASIYADRFEGRETASGAPFRQDELTAASRDLPLGSRIRVTNPRSGHTVHLEVTDRGPFVRGRILDLSRAAAHRLGIDPRAGLATVRIEVFAGDQSDDTVRQALRRHQQRAR